MSVKVSIRAGKSAIAEGILRLRKAIRFAYRLIPVKMAGPQSAIVLLLLLRASAGATSYYVSSSTGSDTNNGTSASTSWQTIAHVNAQSFQPGDSILFRRGDVWNESLVPASSGTSGNPITFDAYGTGAAPNLTGYYVAPPSSWVLVTGNAWKAPLPSTYSTITFCLFGSIWGQKVAAATANLIVPRTFYLANGYVYVFSVGNPATYYHAAVVPMALSNVPVININSHSWLTFQHFLVNWFDQYGVYVQGTSDHLVFANMEADSMIPQGTQPLGFYVNESAPGPGDIKIYNAEAHMNYDGFRFDGSSTAITMINDKGYANRDGALVDNTGSVTYSYCHFYASSLAVAGSTDVESTSGSGPTAEAGNIPADMPPAVQAYQRYPAEVTLTVDDAGMTPGADSYYANTVLPIADAAAVPVGAAITVGYPLAQTLVSEFQGWVNAGRDVTSHSMSHTYYTNTDALEIQYTGSGTAATLNINNKTLTITVTGASDGLSYSLAQGQTQGTILGLQQALAATGKFTTSYLTPCQGPYGTGCSAYTAQGLLSQDLADVSGQDVKTSVYHMQLDVTRLTTDEITLSRKWMTANLTGLPATPVYVYPGGYETTAMQGIAASVPYTGARGALKQDLGVKDTYADGFNLQNITSFGVNPSWMGLTPASLNQKIQALVWKEAVWGVPWGIFWHLNELTNDDPVGGTEITNLIQDLKTSGATIQTNTGLVNWLRSGMEETGTDGNYYYALPATSMAVDFRPTRNSPVVDAGENLGTAYELDINGVNQNTYGSSWEIGAHVFEGYAVYGENGGTGEFKIGGPNLASLVTLPQVWVNSYEGDTLFSYELSLPSTWVTGPAPSCTFHVPYWTGAATNSGLQLAVNDIETCRTATGAGIKLDIPPALYTSAIGLVIPQSSNSLASSFLILDSTEDSSLVNGTTVCSHGIQDNLASSTDPGVDNPDCAGDAMYYQLGTTVTNIPAGAFTLANGTVTNTSNYNDVQYMWTLESSGTNPSALTTCSPLGTSSSSNPPKCESSTLAPDHWLIEDMEARMAAGNTGNGNIVNLNPSTAETSISQLPTHIHLRKDWVHGDWASLATGANSISAAISFACVYCSILDSQISEVLRPSAEGHQIYTSYGTSLKINHNWGEGQSIGLFSGGFSGAGPSIFGLIPHSDVEERRNRWTKPWSWLGVGTISGNSHGWNGDSLVLKNSDELKVGQRVLRDGNIIENVDGSGGQSGVAGDIKDTNASTGFGTNYLGVTTDVTMTNNIVRNDCIGWELVRGNYTTGGASPQLNRINISNNLFYNQSESNWANCGTPPQGLILNSGGMYWQGTVTENAAGTALTFVANCSVDQGGCPGQVASLAVNSAGTGCVAGSLTFSAPNLTGGEPPAGTYSCSGGVLSALTLTAPGSGYTSAPTATLATGTGTVTVTLVTAPVTPATGAQVLDIAAGDPVVLTQCSSVTAFNQTTAVSSGQAYPTARGPLALAGSSPWSGTPSTGNLTVTIPWSATANASDTAGYCKISNVQGGPENVLWTHNTMVSNSPQIVNSGNNYKQPPNGPNYEMNTVMRDSIMVGGTIDNPTLGAGNPTVNFNFDTSTLTLDHMVWPAQGSFTPYCNNAGFHCASPIMFFPATPYCTGATSASSCVGFAGAMNMSSMPIALNDYHGYELRSDSVFYAGNADQASDGTTQAANIPAIDQAQTRSLYVCQTACGAAGPYPDLPVQTVAKSFFGQHVNVTTDPFPTISFGAYRNLTGQTDWADIETASGSYSFSKLNGWIAKAQAAGVDVMYTLFRTPTFYSSNPTGMCTGVSTGTCYPPTDIAASCTNTNGQNDCDGKTDGTNQSFKNFVSALVANSGSGINFYEGWNEYNQTWEGTTGQLVKMMQDARAIVLAANPAAKFLNPSVVFTYNLTTGAPYLTPWNTLMATPGIDAVTDIINFHGYTRNTTASLGVPELEVPLVTGVRATLDAANAAKPLWISEFGWGASMTDGFTDPDQRAAYIARAEIIAASLGVQRAYWFGWDENNGAGTLWWPNNTDVEGCNGSGTIDAGGYLCEAGAAQQTVYNWLLNAMPQGSCSGPAYPALGVWTCFFTGAGTVSAAEIIWDSSQTCSGGSCTTSTYIPSPGYTQYINLAGQAAAIGAGGVQVGSKPILLN